MRIKHDFAALVGFACEAVLYGCHIILFAVSIHLMLRHARNRDRKSVNRIILTIYMILFLCCSTHFVLEFTHYYKTLSTKGVKGFSLETNELKGADLLISITDFLGEIILIYRCWLLWSKNYWVITLPSLAAIGSIVCIVVVTATPIDPHATVVPQYLVSLGVAGYVLPLCSNVVITTLIAVRIWDLSPRNPRDIQGTRFPANTGRAAIDIVVESGMLYLAVQLVFVILFALRNPAQDIAGMMAVQIYGIAPALIIIRVSLGWSSGGLSSAGSRGASHSGSGSTHVVSMRFGKNSTDADQRIATLPEISVTPMKFKSLGQDLDSTSSEATHV